MADQIIRDVMAACARGEHQHCTVWEAAVIDGQLRTAGRQCTCSCHLKQPEEPCS